MSLEGGMILIQTPGNGKNLKGAVDERIQDIVS